MTAEIQEAIDHIKRYRKLDEDLHKIAPEGSISYVATGECLKYWDMAIQALERESCEDSIPRRKVLQLLMKSVGRDNLYIQTEVMKMDPVRPKCADTTPFYERMKVYCQEHGIVLVDKDVWNDTEKDVKKIRRIESLVRKWTSWCTGNYQTNRIKQIIDDNDNEC